VRLQSIESWPRDSGTASDTTQDNFAAKTIIELNIIADYIVNNVEIKCCDGATIRT
jgi:hypothetical protein